MKPTTNALTVPQSADQVVTIALPSSAPSADALRAVDGAQPTLQPVESEIRINWLHGTPGVFPPCWYVTAQGDAPHGWKTTKHPTSGATIYAKREIVITVLAARQYWYVLPADGGAAQIVPDYRPGAKKTLQLRCWSDDVDGLVTVSLSKVTKSRPIYLDLQTVQTRISSFIQRPAPLYLARLRCGALLDERGQPRWEKLQQGAVVCSPRVLAIEDWNDGGRVAFFRQVADDLAETWVRAITGEPVEGVVVNEQPQAHNEDDVPF